MLEIIKSWKYKDIETSSPQKNLFYVLENNVNGNFYHNHLGSVCSIYQATRYTSVGRLKQAIKKVYYPQNKFQLIWDSDTNSFKEFKIPLDAFDDCVIHLIRII